MARHDNDLDLRSRIRRAPRWLAACLATVGGASLQACGASGSPEGPPSPSGTRNVVRYGDYAPVEMWNDPGISARTVGVSLANVWAVLPAVYERFGIEPRTVDPGAYVIGNGNFTTRRLDGERLNTFVDCGTGLGGPLANEYEVKMSVFTELTPGRADSTVMMTTVDAYAEPMAVSGNEVHCQSRGELELRVTRAVIEVLTGGR